MQFGIAPQRIHLSRVYPGNAIRLSWQQLARPVDVFVVVDFANSAKVFVGSVAYLAQGASLSPGSVDGPIQHVVGGKGAD